MRLGIVAVLIGTVSSCGADVASPVEVVTFPLPVADVLSCPTAAIEDVLRASPTDARRVWLEGRPATRLVWPPGYTVRFTRETAEIVDANGDVALRDGTELTGLCLLGPPGDLESIMRVRTE